MEEERSGTNLHEKRNKCINSFLSLLSSLKHLRVVLQFYAVAFLFLLKSLLALLWLLFCYFQLFVHNRTYNLQFFLFDRKRVGGIYAENVSKDFCKEITIKTNLQKV